MSHRKSAATTGVDERTVVACYAAASAVTIHILTLKVPGPIVRLRHVYFEVYIGTGGITSLRLVRKLGHCTNEKRRTFKTLFHPGSLAGLY